MLEATISVPEATITPRTHEELVMMAHNAPVKPAVSDYDRYILEASATYDRELRATYRGVDDE